MLDIVLCPSLPDVAASRAEHLFESEDAIESPAQVLEAFRDAEKRGLPGWELEQQSGHCPRLKPFPRPRQRQRHPVHSF